MSQLTFPSPLSLPLPLRPPGLFTTAIALNSYFVKRAVVSCVTEVYAIMRALSQQQALSLIEGTSIFTSGPNCGTKQTETSVRDYIDKGKIQESTNKCAIL
jgi:hypothetical protein